jgi:hypothetical protein
VSFDGQEHDAVLKDALRWCAVPWVRLRRATVTDPAIRDGDRYQPMWPELEALVGSRDARGESPCGALAALAE